MTPDYYPKKWLRILDMAGMVIAPISVSLPFFFLAIGFYLEASSKGTRYYELAIVIFLAALAMLIIFGIIFWDGIKLYVNHEATREKAKDYRVMYSIFILGSLLIYFMIVYAFFFGRIS